MQRYNAHVVTPACNACILNMGWLQSVVWQIPDDVSLEPKALYSAQIYQMIQIVQPESSKRPRWCMSPNRCLVNFDGNWQRIYGKERQNFGFNGARRDTGAISRFNFRSYSHNLLDSSSCTATCSLLIQLSSLVAPMETDSSKGLQLTHLTHSINPESGLLLCHLPNRRSWLKTKTCSQSSCNIGLESPRKPADGYLNVLR
jgi:hypothetical protein